MQKCVPNLVRDPFLILVKTQNGHYMQEILLKIRYFEIALSKALKEVNFVFSSEPSPFLIHKNIKNKRGLELVTSYSSGYETSSKEFLY